MGKQGNEGQAGGVVAGVRDVRDDEMASLLREVDAWAQSYAVQNFADFHRRIVVRGARLYTVPWVKLNSRLEARSLSEATKPYHAGQAYERRAVSSRNFAVWSYALREPGAPVRFGQPSAPVVLRVPHSDVLLDCAVCDAHGRLACGKCSGHGKILCQKCAGAQHIGCKKCDGVGQAQCRTCCGRGENDCPHCRNGTDIVTQRRCTSCHGRGYSPCAECQHGYQPCKPCGTTGQVSCPGCGAQGYVSCKTCAGSGELSCDSCDGSGELISTYYLTSSETDAGAAAYVTTAEFDDCVPDDVNQWARRALTTLQRNSAEAERFDRVPLAHRETLAADMGQQLIDAAHGLASWTSDKDVWDMSNGGAVSRLNWQRYSENHLPLVALHYTFEGREYRLWSAAPCTTTLVEDATLAAGSAAIANDISRHFRDGSSVYARHSPIQEYFDDLSASAQDCLARGELKEADRLAREVLASMPNDEAAIRLRAGILETHNHCSAGGALAALGVAVCLHFLLSYADAIAAVSGWKLLGQIVFLLIGCCAPLGLSRVFFPTKKTALIFSFIPALILAALIMCPFVK